MRKVLKKSFLIFIFTILFTSVAFAYTPQDMIGSWYGEYTGYSGEVSVERFMQMTIEECDELGNIKGEAYVTTQPNQGYDHQWINYKFEAKVDFYSNAFQMQGVKKIKSDQTGNWLFAEFLGQLAQTPDNDLFVSGIVAEEEYKYFYFGKVSDWAKTEIMMANLYNLVPDTMKGKDLTKPITRAEFAAVANQLYETLTDTKTTALPSTFLDIYGNPDEESIKKAHSLNITVGFSDTEFGPSLLITREQLATMLCRAIKKYKYPEWTFATDDQYYLLTAGVPLYADDHLIEDYAKQSVYYMTKMKIIKGLSGNYFGPKNVTDEQIATNYATATREQAIVMALRIFAIKDKI